MKKKTSTHAKIYKKKELLEEAESSTKEEESTPTNPSVTKGPLESFPYKKKDGDDEDDDEEDEDEDEDDDDEEDESWKQREIFQKYSPDFISKGYFLFILAGLGTLGYDYYSSMQQYLKLGANEGFFYFCANLLFLFILTRFWFITFIKKCKKKLHIVLLIAVPLIFIQLEVETYMSESPKIIPFERWFSSFKKGGSYFYDRDKRNLKKAHFYFTKAYDDSPKSPQNKLYQRASLYLGLIEMTAGKNEAALKRFEEIEKYFPHKMNLEWALLAAGLAKTQLAAKKNQDAYVNIERCLKVFDRIKIDPNDYIKINFLYDCRFQKGLFLVTRNNFDEAFGHLESYFNHYFSLYTSSKKLKGQSTRKIMQVLNLLMKIKKYDIALEYNEKILNKIRDSQQYEDLKVLADLYKNISEIYAIKNEELRSNIYLDNAKAVENILKEKKPDSTKNIPSQPPRAQ